MAHKINAKDAKDASLLLYTQNLTTPQNKRKRRKRRKFVTVHAKFNYRKAPTGRH